MYVNISYTCIHIDVLISTYMYIHHTYTYTCMDTIYNVGGKRPVGGWRPDSWAVGGRRCCHDHDHKE